VLSFSTGRKSLGPASSAPREGTMGLCGGSPKACASSSLQAYSVVTASPRQCQTSILGPPPSSGQYALAFSSAGLAPLQQTHPRRLLFDSFVREQRSQVALGRRKNGSATVRKASSSVSHSSADSCMQLRDEQRYLSNDEKESSLSSGAASIIFFCGASTSFFTGAVESRESQSAQSEEDTHARQGKQSSRNVCAVSFCLWAVAHADCTS